MNDIVVYTRLPKEEELLGHLKARRSIVVHLPGVRLSEVERQIERLGLEDECLVSAIRGMHGEGFKIVPTNTALH